MRRAALLLGCLLLGGCVYFNGVYNARRLTREAERAERDGRRFEAQNLYGQVATKAESVLARHPGSSWADDARFLRGNALAKLGNCQGARADLEAVAYGSADSALVVRALDVLADCYAELGQWEHASNALTRLQAGGDAAARQRTAARLVTVLRANGRYAQALELIEAEPGLAVSPGDRAAVLAGVGRVEEALPLVDTVLSSPGRDAAPWDSLVAAIGRADPGAASALTDRLAVLDSLPAELRERLLLADAARWREVDTARARLRWQQVATIAPTAQGRGTARLELAAGAIAAARDLEALRPWADTLGAIAEAGGAPAVNASRRQRALTRVLAVVDSARPDTAGSPEGDLILFHAAEALRDSVGAPLAAAGLLELLEERHPASPWAAKALLARAALAPAADSLVAVARERYPDSPYLLALDGMVAMGYHLLEDSLQRWSRARLAPPRRGPRGAPGVPQPDTLN